MIEYLNIKKDLRAYFENESEVNSINFGEFLRWDLKNVVYPIVNVDIISAKPMGMIVKFVVDVKVFDQLREPKDGGTNEEFALNDTMAIHSQLMSNFEKGTLDDLEYTSDMPILTQVEHQDTDVLLGWQGSYNIQAVTKIKPC